jgi:hypothetical protein
MAYFIARVLTVNIIETALKSCEDRRLFDVAFWQLSTFCLPHCYEHLKKLARLFVAILNSKALLCKGPAIGHGILKKFLLASS